MDDPWQRVEDFIRNESGRRNKVITCATSIEGDLGVTGLDADDFMTHFFTTFSVDEGDFDLYRYFGGDASGGLLIALAWIAIQKIRGRYQPKPILTAGMLLAAVIAGKWDAASLEANLK